MLGMERRLLFPFLEFVREDQLVHPNQDKGCAGGRSVTLFTLDWEAFDKERRDRAEHAAKQGGDDWPFFVTLPEPYESEIGGYLFALDKGTVAEVKRNARCAQHEWVLERPFDTMIREVLTQTAIAHTRAAFYLLADCIWDPETRYWRRDRLLPLSAALMTYRFWLEQTGSALPWYHADFFELTRTYSEENIDKHSPTHTSFVRDDSVRRVQAAREAILEVQKRRNAAYDRMRPEPVSGPSLGDSDGRLPGEPNMANPFAGSASG